MLVNFIGSWIPAPTKYTLWQLCNFVKKPANEMSAQSQAVTKHQGAPEQESINTQALKLNIKDKSPYNVTSDE